MQPRSNFNVGVGVRAAPGPADEALPPGWGVRNGSNGPSCGPPQMGSMGPPPGGNSMGMPAIGPPPGGGYGGPPQMGSMMPLGPPSNTAAGNQPLPPGWGQRSGACGGQQQMQMSIGPPPASAGAPMGRLPSYGTNGQAVPFPGGGGRPDMPAIGPPPAISAAGMAIGPPPVANTAPAWGATSGMRAPGSEQASHQWGCQRKEVTFGRVPSQPREGGGGGGAGGFVGGPGSGFGPGSGPGSGFAGGGGNHLVPAVNVIPGSTAEQRPSRVGPRGGLVVPDGSSVLPPGYKAVPMDGGGASVGQQLLEMRELAMNLRRETMMLGGADAATISAALQQQRQGAPPSSNGNFSGGDGSGGGGGGGIDPSVLEELEKLKEQVKQLELEKAELAKRKGNRACIDLTGSEVDGMMRRGTMADGNKLFDLTGFRPDDPKPVAPARHSVWQHEDS